MVFPLSYPLILYDGRPFYHPGRFEYLVQKPAKKDAKKDEKEEKVCRCSAAKDDLQICDVENLDSDDDDMLPSMVDDPSLNIPKRFKPVRNTLRRTGEETDEEDEDEDDEDSDSEVKLFRSRRVLQFKVTHPLVDEEDEDFLRPEFFNNEGDFPEDLDLSFSITESDCSDEEAESDKPKPTIEMLIDNVDVQQARNFVINLSV